MIGTGGAPEGVLAAAALRCVQGDMQGVLQPRNEAEVVRAGRMGINDIAHVFEIDELASGDVMFAATGITDGFLLRGVRFRSDGADSHSIVMRSRSGTVRHIHTRHRFGVASADAKVRSPHADSQGSEGPSPSASPIRGARLYATISH